MRIFNHCIQKIKDLIFGIHISYSGNGKTEAVECNMLALDLLKTFATDLLITSVKALTVKFSRSVDFVGKSPFGISKLMHLSLAETLLVTLGF